MPVNILKWIFLSSKDSSKVSLMIKGLATFIPSAILLLGAFNIDVEAGTLEAVLDTAATFVGAAFAVVAAGAALWGAIRKVNTTAKGTNEVVNKEI